MTLVGTWDVEVSLQGGGSFKDLQTSHLGGTSLNSTAIILDNTQVAAYGSWKKEGNGYIHSFYFLLEDVTLGNVFVKVLQEIFLVGKNTFEGQGDLLLLLGPDPFNPIDTIVLSQGETLFGRRLEPEGP